MSRIGKRIKRGASRLRGQHLDRTLDIERSDAVTLGTDYGAHTVALDPLNQQSIVYSVGLGTDVSFDLELIERKGLSVHGFDPTPESLAWLQRQQLPDTFVVHDVGVAGYDGTAKLHAPDNPDHVSHTLLPRRGRDAATVSVHRLATLMETLGHESLDVLKIDIEGAEYAVLEGLATAKLPIKQLLIEYHHQFEDVPVEKTRESIARLRAAGYRAFAVSETGREWSFLHTGVS